MSPLYPGQTAIGTWSGGRFMRFGEPLDDERFLGLITPDEHIRTVITADVYGEGEADRMLGRALAGVPRDQVCVVGAVGHDFYTGERDGAKGFPRFTDRRLRDESEYANYLAMATERSLERCEIGSFDLLLLHNPDRTGYTSETVWSGMAALRDLGLTRQIGVAPGPANGFTLDLIDCFERFGELIDWAMIILNPLEPWPGELCLPAAADAGINVITRQIGVAPGPANGFTLDLIDCFERFGELIDWAMIILNPLEPWPGELCLPAAADAGISVITRVVDYGGLFWDDVLPGQEFPRHDHRGFRPAGWIEAGRQRLESMWPIAQRAGLTMLQLACQWNLAQPAVHCVAPTLIQEMGPQARPVEEKRAELAALPPESRLSPVDLDEIRALGDNTGCMALKGASPEHDGEERPDRWGLDERLHEVARRWRIDPQHDLIGTAA